jgi:hypothetical protein
VSDIRELHERAARGEIIDWSAARSAAESAGESAWSARDDAWRSIAAKSIEIFKAAPIRDCELCIDRLSAAKSHVSKYQLVA